MKLRIWRHDLTLAHRWTIARGLGPGGDGGSDSFGVAFIELTDKHGVVGLGEASPSKRYGETVDSVVAFFEHLNPYQLSFDDLEGSLRYLETVGARNYCAKGAVNLALLDGAARLAGKPVNQFLGLGFTEGRHLTSFSIGLADPETTRKKVAEAAAFPVLKIKLGGPDDRATLAAVRDVAPDKPLRVDANEGWKTKEAAVQALEWLAADRRIEFVEQPMPASTPVADLAWLKARSPLPLMADESYVYEGDLPRVVDTFHAVNVKLVKAGGATAGLAALRAARNAGLKTMLGCMIESSVLISAAAHLAELTDYLDLDGNLLITNDPYQGVRCDAGRLSFAGAPHPAGLQVGPA
jgi:L-alanine-DL-glutamate epimerase-like enolase superfamily enzyme